MTLANASRNALSVFGGDSPVVFKYAVLKRSVASSSREEILPVVGAGVCDPELEIERGSETSLYVHFVRGCMNFSD